ncbi:MAG: YdeI/OmpD-associated family protein [Chloroflexota bacterium]
MEPVFFATPAELRSWLEENHDKERELLVGLYKKGTGKPSITWPEVVDQALCFGWIDGIRKGIDEESYTNRITPRKPRSNWSAVNIKRVGELTELGLMQPAGLKAFEKRLEEKSVVYSYEQGQPGELPEEYEAEFRANKKAWDFFQAQAPWYRRTSIWRIVSAKKEETQRKRLAALIEASEQGRTT